MQKTPWVPLAVTGTAGLLLIWLAATPAPRALRYPEPRATVHRQAVEQASATLPPPPTATGTATTRAVTEPAAEGLAYVALALMTLLALVAAAGVALWAWRTLRSLRVPQLSYPETSREALVHVPAAVVKDAEQIRAALRTGTPAIGVVAAWAALEDAAATAGIPVAAHETSSEYTERVIGAWVQDAEPLHRLAALYREARFSSHHMGAAARAAAVQSLDEVLTQLSMTSGDHHVAG